jgi:hypothetical protein
MKTDQELQQIAQDMRDGRLFSDRHCKDLYELRSSFLIISLMDEEQTKKMEADKIDFVYEYYDKAAPRSVNGRPIFLSCGLLNQDESKKMFAFYEKTTPVPVTSG